MLPSKGPPLDPFTIAFDALLRPARFATWLEGDGRHRGWAVLTTAIWTGAMVVLVGWGAGPLLQLAPRGVVSVLGLSLALSTILASLGIVVGGGHASVADNVVFWLARCQLAYAPPLTIVLALGFSSRVDQAPILLLLGFVLLSGALTGSLFTLVLARRASAHEAVLVRSILAFSSLLLATWVWYVPVAIPPERWALAPWLLGFGLGLLRPFSWLWEAPLSLGFLLAHRCHVIGASRLRQRHPVQLDELSLLPLPGLTRALIEACGRDLDEGIGWLLEVAHHPGQHHAVRLALRHIANMKDLAHPVLFRLSTSAGGRTLLLEFVEQGTTEAPLILAYAAVAHVVEPDAWPTVIAQHHAVWILYHSHSGGSMLLTLLDVGVAVLAADRWPVAVRALHEVAVPLVDAADTLWQALDALVRWIQSPTPKTIIEHRVHGDAILALLDADSDSEADWPAQLIAAVVEHALFLLNIEQRKGAWIA